MERANPGRGRAAEFVGLYFGAPLALALALPPSALPLVLLATTLLGAVLLARTPGFAWSELARGWGAIDWAHVGTVAAVTAAATGLLVWRLAPQQALVLPRTMPALWLTILAFYPLLSALPQELVFRSLFFRRYGGLFPSRGAALAANALVFGLAHLMFWNWVAVPLSVAGGLIFAHGYLARGGFAMAVALHAVCGGIVFTSGLGTFFYHGAVAAP
ncbi:MAG: CPBP family intramembrane metalloprotease [Rhodobacteraceae bacterium]|nr:CPBP family intramembrane metalloprotease [Paracoccaceae bacterium]